MLLCWFPEGSKIKSGEDLVGNETLRFSWPHGRDAAVPWTCDAPIAVLHGPPT